MGYPGPAPRNLAPHRSSPPFALQAPVTIESGPAPLAMPFTNGSTARYAPPGQVATVPFVNAPQAYPLNPLMQPSVSLNLFQLPTATYVKPGSSPSQMPSF